MCIHTYEVTCLYVLIYHIIVSMYVSVPEKSITSSVLYYYNNMIIHRNGRKYLYIRVLKMRNSFLFTYFMKYGNTESPAFSSRCLVIVICTPTLYLFIIFNLTDCKLYYLFSYFNKNKKLYWQLKTLLHNIIIL